MENVQNFICWALTHAKSVPTGAAMPLPADACCAEPWHYLFGSVRVQTTPATLARYRQAYINRGWAGADFDAAVIAVTRFAVHSVVYDFVSSASGINVIVPSELNLAFMYLVDVAFGSGITISPRVVTAKPFFPPIPIIN